MTRIALCLYGYFNNRRDPLSGLNGARYIEEQILKGRNVDIFLFSWEPHRKEQLESIYRPQKALFAEMPDLSDLLREYNINEAKYHDPTRDFFRNVRNHLGFFLSRRTSIELKKEAEREKGIVYDWVIASRFDLGQMDKVNGNQNNWYRMSEIVFDPSLDPEYFYSGMWDQFNQGYGDQWFYSKSANIDILADLFERALYYYQDGSSWEKVMLEGLPDSNADQEFSNELLKPKKLRSKNLVKYKQHQLTNVHAMHKWFFMETGLYDKSRFLYLPEQVALRGNGKRFEQTNCE